MSLERYQSFRGFNRTGQIEEQPAQPAATNDEEVATATPEEEAGAEALMALRINARRIVQESDSEEECKGLSPAILSNPTPEATPLASATVSIAKSNLRHTYRDCSNPTAPIDECDAKDAEIVGDSNELVFSKGTTTEKFDDTAVDPFAPERRIRLDNNSVPSEDTDVRYQLAIAASASAAKKSMRELNDTEIQALADAYSKRRKYIGKREEVIPETLIIRIKREIPQASKAEDLVSGVRSLQRMAKDSATPTPTPSALSQKTGQSNFWQKFYEGNFKNNAHNAQETRKPAPMQSPQTLLPKHPRSFASGVRSLQGMTTRRGTEDTHTPSAPDSGNGGQTFRQERYRECPPRRR